MHIAAFSHFNNKDKNILMIGLNREQYGLWCKRVIIYAKLLHSNAISRLYLEI